MWILIIFRSRRYSCIFNSFLQGAPCICVFFFYSKRSIYYLKKKPDLILLIYTIKTKLHLLNFIMSFKINRPTPFRLYVKGYGIFFYFRQTICPVDCSRCPGYTQNKWVFISYWITHIIFFILFSYVIRSLGPSRHTASPPVSPYPIFQSTPPSNAPAYFLTMSSRLKRGIPGGFFPIGFSSRA